MYRINKPMEIAGDVYLICVNMVRDVELKERLKAGEDLITAASTEFNDKITTGTMHSILREDIVNGNLTKKELELVYTLRMAKKGAAGRPFYDKLLLSAKLGICPLCSHREATTIDHYLPKTEYPRLSVVPINLVPCCKDCNDVKGSFYPVEEFQEIIHPYFDNVENKRWLNAEIIHTTPCSVKYSIIAPDGWQQLLIDRVRFHFEKMQLRKLYSTQAAVELSMIRSQLNKLLLVDGPVGVKKLLSEAEDSRSQVNINSWQAVFYKAAMHDSWFCNGGFN